MSTSRSGLCRHSLSVLSLALLAALLSGCGSGDAKNNLVTGKVTVDGHPLANGSMTLHYDDGKKYPVPLKSDGTFNISQVPLGKAQVSFAAYSSGMQGVAAEKQAEFQKYYAAKAPAEQQAKAAQALETGPAIPEKYTNPKTSDLSWEIKAGKNEKTFDLK